MTLRRILVGLTNRLGRVESGWVEIFQFLVGWVGFLSTTAKVLKSWQNYFNPFKAGFGKICLHQAVKFDFICSI